jgi:hypothetical protein
MSSNLRATRLPMRPPARSREQERRLLAGPARIRRPAGSSRLPLRPGGAVRPMPPVGRPRVLLMRRRGLDGGCLAVASLEAMHLHRGWEWGVGDLSLGFEHEHLDSEVGIDVVIAHEADHPTSGQVFDLAAHLRLHHAPPASAQIEDGVAPARVGERLLAAREGVLQHHEDGVLTERGSRLRGPAASSPAASGLQTWTKVTLRPRLVSSIGGEYRLRVVGSTIRVY